jgi:hypothetical protein
MPKRVKLRKIDVAGVPKGKVRTYTVLYHVKEAFDQILAQLQELDKSSAWRRNSG